ncbi:putative serine/threonine-protein phosphatase 2A catalytic subunit B [Symbiodinium microadriaticum]|uniref:protein-serine/threonine phosphatase n=1 Tax=Symbiodinium microadriaticum TaxID=2951 RepID=A0A1Q9CFR5_SYMMI|nr:putative serine/threonine-protein phosphatase 2A catalytic subunit B [Symbiodinium microadriaticum]
MLTTPVTSGKPVKKPPQACGLRFAAMATLAGESKFSGHYRTALCLHGQLRFLTDDGVAAAPAADCPGVAPSVDGARSGRSLRGGSFEAMVEHMGGCNMARFTMRAVEHGGVSFAGELAPSSQPPTPRGRERVLLLIVVFTNILSGVRFDMPRKGLPFFLGSSGAKPADDGDTGSLIWIGGSLLAVHGGLSPSIHHLDQIRLLDRFSEIPHDGPLADLMWSDPDPDKTGFVISPRGAGYVFGQDVAEKFLHVNQLSHIVRAHQLCMSGYQVLFDDTLSTVWSAPNYCYRFGNIASILEVSEEGSRFFNVFGPAPESAEKTDTSLEVHRERIRDQPQRI